MSTDSVEGFAGHAPAEPSVDEYERQGWTPAAPDAGPAQPGRGRRIWLGWRRWRRSRPFWGGLFSILAGTEIMLTETAPLPVVLHLGPTGLVGLALPILIALCGVLLWCAPQPRVLYASLILLATLGTWITSNLGGFFLGLILGLIGGALALTWTIEPRPATTAVRHRRRRGDSSSTDDSTSTGGPTGLRTDEGPTVH